MARGERRVFCSARTEARQAEAGARSRMSDHAAERVMIEGRIPRAWLTVNTGNAASARVGGEGGLSPGGYCAERQGTTVVSTTWRSTRCWTTNFEEFRASNGSCL